MATRKQNTPNFPKNEYFLPSNTHRYVSVSEGKKCSFFWKFGVFCFLETSVLRFALLPYYRRNLKIVITKKQSTPNFFEKRLFLTDTCMCAFQGVNVRFLGKFGVLCFLETTILRFALLLYYRRFNLWVSYQFNSFLVYSCLTKTCF